MRTNAGATKGVRSWGRHHLSSQDLRLLGRGLTSPLVSISPVSKLSFVNRICVKHPKRFYIHA